MLVVPAAITTVVLIFLILSITEDGSTTTKTDFVHSFMVTNSNHRHHRQVLRVPRTRRTHYPFQAHPVQGSSILSARVSSEETQYEAQLEATRRRMLGGRVGIGPHPNSKSNSKSSNSRISPFDTILQSRRTIQSFVPDLPAQWEVLLHAAITSALYAPNHKRTEPWTFYVLGPETIRQVCALQADLVTQKKGPKAGQAKYERWLTMPGWLVVTCRTTKSSDDGSSITLSDPTGVQREDYAAVCCAIQNLCLSLHQAGMGTKWTTGPVNFDPQFNTIVGINNNTDTTEETEEFVVGTIWFGTPADATYPPPPPMKKKQLQDVLIKTK